MRRLTTWNLFFSAGSYERGEPFSYTALSDLCTLADTFCLYERVFVPGESGKPPFQAHDDLLLAAIRDSGFVTVIETPPRDDHDAWGQARMDVEALLSIDTRRAQRMLEAAIERNHGVDGDTSNTDMNVEARQTELTPGVPMLNLESRTAEYIVRTFMYRALATGLGCQFVPDAQRVSLIQAASPIELDLAGEAARVLRESWQKTVPEVGGEIRNFTSPLGAVVIERAQGDAARLPDELLKLRNELSGVRDRILDFENKMLEDSLRDAQEASRRWKRAMGELRDAYGNGVQAISIQQGIHVTGTAAETAAKDGWKVGLLEVIRNFTAEPLLSMLRRRPVVELHQLHRETPAWGRLLRRARVLYGNAGSS